MADASAIRENMEVIGADGVHIGVVDHLRNGRIKLNRHDRGSGGKHHFLDVSHVADVEGDKVRLAFNSDLIGGFWDTEEDPWPT